MELSTDKGTQNDIEWWESIFDGSDIPMFTLIHGHGDLTAYCTTIGHLIHIKTEVQLLRKTTVRSPEYRVSNNYYQILPSTTIALRKLLKTLQLRTICQYSGRCQRFWVRKSQWLLLLWKHKMASVIQQRWWPRKHLDFGLELWRYHALIQQFHSPILWFHIFLTICW